MRFRTTPHPIAHLLIENVVSRRYAGRIFKISKLDLRDFDFMMFLLPIDYDVVRLQICNISAIAQEPFSQQRSNLPLWTIF